MATTVKKIDKRSDDGNIIPVRPVARIRVELGEYLRNERIKIGLTSAEAFVDYLEEVTGLPKGTVTPRMFYNLEAAKNTSKVEAMPFFALEKFAENLFKNQPDTQYLINPRTAKPFSANDLLCISYGWIDLYTGEEVVKLISKE